MLGMSSVAKAWLERTNWANRTERFGNLRLVRGVGELATVSMEFGTPHEIGSELWIAWLGLPRHPALIRALAPGVLRYVAIDWRFSRLDPGYESARVARYGSELCDLYAAIVGHLGADEATWFVRPIVTVDVEGMVRVAFTSPSPVERSGPTPIVDALGRVLE